MTIGKRIKMVRKELKMKQGVLCAKVGIKQPTLSELENGDSAGSAFIPEIAAALGVNALWLQKEIGPKYPIQNITQKEMVLIMAYRDASDEGKKFIEMACSSAAK